MVQQTSRGKSAAAMLTPGGQLSHNKWYCSRFQGELNPQNDTKYNGLIKADYCTDSVTTYIHPYLALMGVLWR